MKTLPLFLAVGLVTCSETVRLNPTASRVEFISHEYMGKHDQRCTEVAKFEVTAAPKEISGEDRHDVLDVKAKNEARKLDATHVLRWPVSEWPCNKDGTPNDQSERMCSKRDISAYQCLVGR